MIENTMLDIKKISSRGIFKAPTDIQSLIAKIRNMSDGISILLVDDDDELLYTCQNLLKRLFKVVDTASNGQEALDMITSEEKNYDLLITDISMPLMDGYELSTKIRELQVDISIIVLTAHSESYQMLGFIALDIDGYCLKPFNDLSLFQVIYKVVSRIFLTKEYIRNMRLLLTSSRFEFAQELLENIAHQWRQPLTAIMCQLSNISYDHHLPHSIEEDINTASYKLSELSDMITNFLSFYKYNSQKEFFTIISILESIKLLMADKLHHEEIIFDIDDRSTHNQIFGIKHEIADALLNIVLNSLDIFKERKVLNPKISSVITNNDTAITLIFQDNGGGFHDDMEQKAFDPYSTTKHKERNKGLGLFVTQTNITKNGGTVVAHNKDGGAIFTITFPIQNEK